MKEVLSVDVRDISGLDTEYIQATALEVKALQTGRGIVLTIDFPRESQLVDPLVVILSPPAAAQLSRSLKKAVKNYLRGTPETE